MSTIPVPQPASSAEHLVPQNTDRGFKRMPPIPCTYDGDVRVNESSRADGPHLWLFVRMFEDLNHRDTSPIVEAGAHLTCADALRLAEQLRWAVLNHYQRIYGGVDPGTDDEWIAEVTAYWNEAR